MGTRGEGRGTVFTNIDMEMEFGIWNLELITAINNIK